MVSAVCYRRSADIREFKQRQQRERQNSNRFIEQNKTFARASRFLYISLPFLHNYDVKLKCLFSCFMEDVNKRRRNFLSLSKLRVRSPRNQLQGNLSTLDIFSELE